MHYQAHAMAAIMYTMVGAHDMSRRSLQIVWSANPDYDINEFYSVYAFQKDEDIRRITQTFKEAKRNF